MTIQKILLASGITLLILWVSIMILWWKEEKQENQTSIDEDIKKQKENLERYSRRFYYFLILNIKKINNKIVIRFKKITQKHFPKIHKTISKPDPLLGFKNGPSSYFLHTISDSKKEEK